MNATYTIDASVFVSAYRPNEAASETCRALLDKLRTDATPIIVPTLLVPEAAGAVSRTTGNAELARRFADALQRLPGLVWVPLDATLARQAADLAAEHALRGSDAVYAAVARRFGSTLVTLDRQQLERAAAAVDTRTPAEALLGS